MARQRLVKPDVFQHVELHRAETVSRLPLIRAYIGLWCQCDRRGCFEWKPEKLKLHILPFDNVDFEAVLSALESNAFVWSYVVDGRRFGYVPTFERHQHFHKNEQPNPLIPDPPKHRPCTVLAPEPHDASTPVSSNRIAAPTPISASVAAPPTAATTAGDAALTLTITANQAIAARFGEQPDPLINSSAQSHAVASAVLAESIPLDFAMRSIARQARDSLSKPPRSLKYFLPGIRDDWAKENARAAASAASPVVPLDRRAKNGTPAPKGSPPVPDDGVVCRACGATAFREHDGKLIPDHRPSCPLSVPECAA